MSQIDKILSDRGAEYGPFYEQASLACALKDVMMRGNGWQQLAPDMREALEMFAVKQARILTGNPAYKDNWRDIEGYSKLVADRLE